MFNRIDASVADAAAVNLSGIKIFLSNALSKFFIKAKQDFSNGPKAVPKNGPILCN